MNHRSRLAAWCPRFVARYCELLAAADTSGWQAAPNAAASLGRLAEAGHRLALLTGNPEPMARARMERLGLARFFPPGQGAFADCARGLPQNDPSRILATCGITDPSLAGGELPVSGRTAAGVMEQVDRALK